MDVAVHAEHDDLTEGTDQALVHLAGYLAHNVLLTHKCRSCQDILINRKALDETTNDTIHGDENMVVSEGKLKSFTDLLSRGGLVCPFHKTVCLTRDVCHIYRWLMK